MSNRLRGSQFRGTYRFRHPLRTPKPNIYAPPPDPKGDQALRSLVLARHQAQGRRQHQIAEQISHQAKGQASHKVSHQAPWSTVLSVESSQQAQTNPGSGKYSNPKARLSDQIAATILPNATFLQKPVDLSKHQPSAPLLSRKPAQFWIRHCAMPWVHFGDTVSIAFGEVAEIERLTPELTKCFGTFIPVVACRKQIADQLLAHFSASMARRASASLPIEHSSRSLLQQANPLPQLLPFTTLLTLAMIFPAEVFSIFCFLALGLLILFNGLKLAGLSAYIGRERRRMPHPFSAAMPSDLPVISVLVPLYCEAEISSALLKRLRRVAYPSDKMEVLLVLEEGDAVTRLAIEHAELPPWISVIQVPIWGDLRTKPRAMNYALNFCRGDIIGVWDAEDAPQPDQLHQVAKAFATAPAEVACFQGVLDYYNPRANLMSRCFTLEYASWFRIILQGIARLDLVVPLGGTTMFVRRKVLEELGGWDAHNVTEDADLGVRLFRAGYRTRMLQTATFEEATCRTNGWVRQRSRWLKGFMATYLVHMRRPVQLCRDLGALRFLGFQAFFLGTIGQFLLAPFLWSYWLVLLGLPHPSAGVVPPVLISFAIIALVFFELLGIFIAATAAFASGRPSLAIWAPCLSFYFMMGVFAVYKALYELLFHPFYWDKTCHGLHPPDAEEEAHVTAPATPAE